MNSKPEDFTFNLYNPSTQDPDTLLDEFIDRKNLLARILDIVQHNTPDKPPQHVILVGPCGMGKTTLLCALKYRVERDKKLKKKWLPIQFQEEQYGIGDLADFWLEALRYLEAELKPEISFIDQLLNENSDQLAEQAQVQFYQLLTQSGKRVLLLVDNINDIFTAIDDGNALNKLRALWMTDSRMMVVGTTPSHFEEVTAVDQAFHDFFRIFSLDRLPQQELESFLRHFAEIQGDDQVIHAIEHEPQRIAAMRILTGGNPRLVKLGYRVLREGIDGDVRRDLERLLDECTPFFKHRIKSLAKEARRTFDAIARRWDPITINDIRLELRKPSNYISAQIKRLIAEGFVEEVSGEKKKHYQVSERFYNVYYLMRHSREGRRRLHWLVSFMQVFYTHNNYKNWARRLGDELSKPLAASQRSEKLSFLHAMSAAADSGGRSAAFETMVRDAITHNDRRALDVEITNCDPVEHFGFRYFAVEILWLLEPDIRAKLGFKPLEQYWWKITRRTLTKENQIEKAELIVKKSKLWNIQTISHSYTAGVIFECFFDQNKEAEKAYLKAIDLDPEYASPWIGLGNVLSKQGQHKEAKDAYQKAIDLDPQYVTAWNNLGLALENQGHHKEAEEAYRKAITLDPLDSITLINLSGICLFNLNQQDEGIALLMQGLSIEPENHYGRYVLKSFWQAVLPAVAGKITTNGNQSGTENLRTVMTETLLMIAVSGEQKTVLEVLLSLDEITQQPFEAILLALQALNDRSVLYHIAREKRDVVLDVMKNIAPDDANNN
ncbi:MAG: tetratricopeptide repeat protein [Betaproteobacteria bacterium]|nr:tetratricopeptide repeat protein [Betaproteobacteria bacterium]